MKPINEVIEKRLNFLIEKRLKISGNLNASLGPDYYKRETRKLIDIATRIDELKKLRRNL